MSENFILSITETDSNGVNNTIMKSASTDGEVRNILEPLIKDRTNNYKVDVFDAYNNIHLQLSGNEVERCKKLYDKYDIEFIVDALNHHQMCVVGDGYVIEHFKNKSYILHKMFRIHELIRKPEPNEMPDGGFPVAVYCDDTSIKLYAKDKFSFELFAINEKTKEEVIIDEPIVIYQALYSNEEQGAYTMYFRKASSMFSPIELTKYPDKLRKNGVFTFAPRFKLTNIAATSMLSLTNDYKKSLSLLSNGREVDG